MYICVCHAVTDTQIKASVQSGCCSYREIRDCHEVGTPCGRCVPETRALINQTLSELATTIARVA